MTAYTMPTTPIDRLAGGHGGGTGHFANVPTIDTVWARVGRDPDNGIQHVAGAAVNAAGQALAAERLIVLLGAQAVREDASDGGAWLDARGRWHPGLNPMAWLAWVRYLTGQLGWPTVAVVVFVVVIGLGFRQHNILTHAPAQVMQVVVRSATALPRFHVIAPGDIQLRRSPAQAGSFTASRDVAGRFSLQTLAHGAIIRTGQVSPGRLSPTDQRDLATRQLLALPVPRSHLASVLAPGDRVTVIYSPRQPGPASVTATPLPGVLVLAVTKQGSTDVLVLAATPATLATVAPLLATSDVFIVQSPPR